MRKTGMIERATIRARLEGAIVAKWRLAAFKSGQQPALLFGARLLPRYRPFCGRVDHCGPVAQRSLRLPDRNRSGLTAVCTMTNLVVGSTKIIWPRIPPNTNLRSMPGSSQI
jgi:hypothetical protein